MVRGQDGMEIKSMIDLVLVKSDMVRYVQDSRSGRGWDETIKAIMFYYVK